VAQNLGLSSIAPQAKLTTMPTKVFEQILHHPGGSRDPTLIHKTGLLATGHLAFFLRHYNISVPIMLRANIDPDINDIASAQLSEY
jgi:hypothetical protein